MASRVSAHLNQSTQAPAHGRRAILVGAVAALVAAPALASSPVDDPIYQIWREWRTLELELLDLGSQQKAMWAALPEWVRSPRVLLMIGKPSGHEFFASTVDEIEHYFFHPASENFHFTPAQIEARKARRDAKIAELEDLERRSGLEQERCGLAALDERIEEITNAQDGLERLIEQSPSISPVAVAAKVDVGFAHSDRDEHLTDLPYCMFAAVVRSVIHELPADMAEALEPIGAGDCTIREVYTRPAAAHDGRA
jgi:hypothetical protein